MHSPCSIDTIRHNLSIFQTIKLPNGINGALTEALILIFKLLMKMSSKYCAIIIKLYIEISDGNKD